MAKKKAAAVEVPLVSECWMIPQVAEHLGVARSTIASAVQAGKITTYRTGCGREMVRLQDVQQYLQDSPGKGFANPEVRAKAAETRGEQPKPKK